MRPRVDDVATGPHLSHRSGDQLPIHERRATLAKVAGADILLDPKANMAVGTTDDDFDAVLLAHFAANPDVNHLILRDASGEAVLVYGAAA